MTDYKAEHLPDLLPVYYKRLFPYKMFYKWLSYGNGKRTIDINRHVSILSLRIALDNYAFDDVPTSSSWQELFSVPWILLYYRRWYIFTIPIIYQCRWNGKRSSKTFPNQNWHWCCFHIQSKYSWEERRIDLNYSKTKKIPIVILAQRTSYGICVSTSWERAGIWYRHDWLRWCKKLLYRSQYL